MRQDGLCCSRRLFRRSGALGMASRALADLLKQDGLLAAEPKNPGLTPGRFDTLPKLPPKPARAKAMISMFMIGGPSQMDLFDPTPLLKEYDGKAFPGE